MSKLPSLRGDGRVRDVVLLAVIGIGEAAALGAAAFATRDAFSALHSNEPVATLTLALFVLAGLGAAGLEFLARRRQEALGQSYIGSLRHVLFDHISGMDQTAVDARRLGSLSLRFVGDLSAARRWFGGGLPRLISAAIVFPSACVVLWLLEPRIALAASVPVAAALIVMLALAAGLTARQVKLRQSRAALSIGMIERIAVAPNLDLMTRTDHELSDLHADSSELAASSVARVTRLGQLRMVAQAGVIFAAAAMLWIGAQANLAPGLLAAGLSVVAILAIPVRELARSWDDYCAWHVARDRAQALLVQPSRRREIVARGRPVGISVQGLIIAGQTLNLEIAAGSFTAIAGNRGSGKSQLAFALAGLDRPKAGRILYDREEAPLPRIAYVSDRPAVVQGSLRRALTMGISPRPSNRKIVQSADDFGLGLPSKGLRSRIGEAARMLSQGEALRLELARTVLSKPDVIVIDSARLLADPARKDLLRGLRERTSATVITVSPDSSDFDVDRVFVVNKVDDPESAKVKEESEPHQDCRRF